MDWHPRRFADGVFWVGSEDGLNRFVPPGVAADVRRLTSRTRKPKTEMLNDQSLLTSAATKKGPEPFFTFTTRQVIMHTVEEDSELVFESLKAGATGYLVKHEAPEEILEAVAQVHRGGAPMSSHRFVGRENILSSSRNDLTEIKPGIARAESSPASGCPLSEGLLNRAHGAGSSPVPMLEFRAWSWSRQFTSISPAT